MSTCISLLLCPVCRHVYTTPKTFLELIKLYRNLLVSATGKECV